MSRFGEIIKELRRRVYTSLAERRLDEAESIYEDEVKKNEANLIAIRNLNETLNTQTKATTELSDKYHALKNQQRALVAKAESWEAVAAHVLLINPYLYKGKDALSCRECVLEEIDKLAADRAELKKVKEELRLAQEAVSALDRQRRAAFGGRTVERIYYKDIPLVFDEVSKYRTPNTKTPDHAWRANPDKKWETSYTKRVVGGLQDFLRKRFYFKRPLPQVPELVETFWIRRAIELLTDYHNTMHEVYEARDFARKQHEAALSSMSGLNNRIADLIKERDEATRGLEALRAKVELSMTRIPLYSPEEAEKAARRMCERLGWKVRRVEQEEPTR